MFNRNTARALFVAVNALPVAEVAKTYKARFDAVGLTAVVFLPTGSGEGRRVKVITMLDNKNNVIADVNAALVAFEKMLKTHVKDGDAGYAFAFVGGSYETETHFGVSVPVASMLADSAGQVKARMEELNARYDAGEKLNRRQAAIMNLSIAKNELAEEKTLGDRIAKQKENKIELAQIAKNKGVANAGQRKTTSTPKVTPGDVAPLVDTVSA